MDMEQKPEEKRVAIVIDSWKYPIFHRHLTKAKYKYEKMPGVTSDTTTLRVLTDDVDSLSRIIKAAANEAQKHRKFHV